MNLPALIVSSLLVLSPAAFAQDTASPTTPATRPMVYAGLLEGPIGGIPFTIELLFTDVTEARGTLVTGDQRVEATQTSIDDESITLSFDYYDAQISVGLSSDNQAAFFENGLVYSDDERSVRYEGEWSKRRSLNEVTRMPLVMHFSGAGEFYPRSAPEVKGWESSVPSRSTIRFSKESEPAVLEVRRNSTQVKGTILTTTGDYRHMSGTLIDNQLTLSTFDAGHAILFKGVINPDGSMSGEYSSGPTYTDTWTGQWDDNAALPDPFSLTTFTGTVEALDALTFPDTEGKPRRVGDFAGKARIIELWGTWCPNCKDAAPVLAELQERYEDKGLSILGLAFEATGDAERDRKQVALYKQRFNIAYPSLIAGVRGKDSAAKAFPMLDQIRAYPSFIFIDGAGKVRGVYTGFTGPAAPEEHERLKRAFDQKVREILGE